MTEHPGATVASTARMLGLGERRVRQLAAARILPGVKTPHGWVFAQADVDAYAQEHAA